jgi:hypothetical protein
VTIAQTDGEWFARFGGRGLFDGLPSIDAATAIAQFPGRRAVGAVTVAPDDGINAHADSRELGLQRLRDLASVRPAPQLALRCRARDNGQCVVTRHGRSAGIDDFLFRPALARGLAHAERCLAEACQVGACHVWCKLAIAGLCRSDRCRHSVEEGIVDRVAAMEPKESKDKKAPRFHWLIPMRSLIAAIPRLFAGSAITWFSWAKIARD